MTEPSDSSATPTLDAASSGTPVPTTASSTASTPGPASAARPWQATIQASLSRVVGVDQVEDIDYENGGRFTRRVRVAGGPEPQNVEVMQDDDLQKLLTALRAQLKDGTSDGDRVGVKVFIDLIEDALNTQPAIRFDIAHFETVTQDERGILFGHLVLGIDMVGTVRDVGGSLSYEQHVVVMEPGTYRTLSSADRASLAQALAAASPTEPLWRRILADARG